MGVVGEEVPSTLKTIVPPHRNSEKQVRQGSESQSPGWQLKSAFEDCGF